MKHSDMTAEDYFGLANEATSNGLEFIRAARVLQQQDMFPKSLALALFGYEELGKGLLWLVCSVRPDLAAVASPFSKRRQHVYKLQAFQLLLRVLQSSAQLVQTEPAASAFQAARDLMGSDTDLAEAIRFLADGNANVLRSVLEGMVQPDLETRSASEAEALFALRSKLLYVDDLSSTPSKVWEQLKNSTDGSVLVSSIEDGSGLEAAEHLLVGIQSFLCLPPAVIAVSMQAMSQVTGFPMPSNSDGEPHQE